jgi:hypothetical protein
LLLTIFSVKACSLVKGMQPSVKKKENIFSLTL